MMQRVGPYEVVRELGRGAMGVVFEVRHPAVSERLALKMILQPEQGGLPRFRREAEVLSFLGRHPNVVGFREAGVEGGHPYIVMDFIDGETLHAALKRDLPRDDALRVLIQIARALHFAHEAEVIHRDVKPANILIDRGGRPFLSDFGVAKSLQADRLTLTGEMVGTPAYMAPEQLSGGSAPIDRRADVYALGAVLYEVLTGVRPFAGDKISVVKKILIDPPPRPGARSASPPPAELEALCLACLAKEPGERPPSAEAFARALEAFLGEGAIGAAERPSGGRGLGVLAVVAPVAIVLAVLLGIGIGRRAAPAEPPTDAVQRGPAPKQVARPDPMHEARELCAAVRIDPKGGAAAPKLLSLAATLLAAVDPKRDGDAVRVEQAWDCLLAALVVAPDSSFRSALKGVDRLADAASERVRRAASPWRALWSGGTVVAAVHVERALGLRSLAQGSEVWSARRETLPLPWGAVVEQVSETTNWWSGRYVRADVRCRVYGELALRRPRLRFVQYELGMALFQLGRLREAGEVLKRSLVGDAGSESWYRVARVLRLYDLPEAEKVCREGLRLGALQRPKRPPTWGEMSLVEILLRRGGAERLSEAKRLLDRSPLKRSGYWRHAQLTRLVRERLGEPLDPGHAQREADLTARGIREVMHTKRKGFRAKHWEDVDPEGAQ